MLFFLKLPILGYQIKYILIVMDVIYIWGISIIFIILSVLFFNSFVTFSKYFSPLRIIALI
jgi:hypothetical protein